MFEAHGKYEISVSDRIVFVRVSGPFNEELSLRYNQDFEKIINELSSQTWAVHVTFIKQSILPPESEKLTKKLALQRTENGMRHVAVILKEETTLPILKAQLTRVYDNEQLEHEFFGDEDEALAWLTSKGYTHDRRDAWN